MARLISDRTLEQIRAANDIVEVINRYFPLKRRGANFVALCPFHKEKTPSFNVHPQKQIWHCFGCGAGGDVFKFLMRYENLSFTEAVRRLAERAGITVEFDAGHTATKREEKELLFRLHEQVAAFFHEQLLQQPATSPVAAYLDKRKIGPTTVGRWRLGYAPDGWDELVRWSAAHKFHPSLLESAGLALKRESGGYYDRFRARLIFPIWDEQGRVVAFSGRTLTDDPDQPKYINSPETAIFQKGRILFALDRAKRAILDTKQAIVCEGQLDTITCHEHGFENVVAPQGTAFTEHHARILKRYADEVILMFDADQAGQNAAIRNAEPLWELGINIRVALLPEGEDPDSFLKKHGAENLRAVLDSAPGFFDFLLQLFSRQLDPGTERGKVQLADQMTPWLCRIRDPVLQAAFAQRTAARLEVREEVLRQKMRDFIRRGTHPHTEPSPTPTPSAAGSAAEATLLQLVLNDNRFLEQAAQQLDIAWLSETVAAKLLRRAIEQYRAGTWNGVHSLLPHANEEEASLLSALAIKPMPKGEPLPLVEGCINTLRRHWLQKQWESVRQQLATEKLPPERAAQLQKHALDLRRKLMNIAPLFRNK
ncbi:MAG: DNA primase [Verrucomicrobiae bacterium]|nr:DNA primase [Verrucomicrobiae bacterium]